MDTRACFKEGVLTGMLKCYYSINQSGNCDKLINSNKIQELLELKRSYSSSDLYKSCLGVVPALY